MKRMSKLPVWCGLAALAAFGQEPAGQVSNSFSLFQETLSGRQVPVVVTVVVTYPDNLEESKYIDLVTVRDDVQGFLRGYPNRQAALEAFAANATVSLMKKYPQLTAAQIVLTNNNAGIQVTASRSIPGTKPETAAAMREELQRALRRLERAAALPARSE
jgi:hypothetical protein